MEKIEGTEMNGDNWYIKRDPLNAKVFIVKTITIWGDEFKRVDSLIEAMDIVKKFKNQEDWIYFTIIFIFSFGIVFLINLVINLSIPELSPIFFHVGITLILFPLINISINFFSFISRLFKS